MAGLWVDTVEIKKFDGENYLQRKRLIKCVLQVVGGHQWLEKNLHRPQRKKKNLIYGQKNGGRHFDHLCEISLQ